MDLLETLKRVVLDNAASITIRCPSKYGLKEYRKYCASDHCDMCWQAAITQEGGEADA